MSNENEDLISSLYPPPPPYYKFFTQENIQKLSEWELTQKQSPPPPPQEQEELSTVVPPGELRFLVPPKQPSGTQYRGYGNIWHFEDKLPSLKESQWTQLYVDDDESITSETKIRELHKLMNSLLLNFLELIGVLSVDPSKFEAKIKDINLILININHLLNTYRPHQSRESLIMLLKKQIDHKKNEISNIDLVCNDIRSKIKKLVDEQIPQAEAESIQVEVVDEKEQLKQDIINKLLQSI
ncbi:Mediator of RNA polymerase II transcription subunit 7 [Candida viswanathii]|uniref:Mediator of RNA polymerase II transcription subunit 7 n=1 Tax=Candida viswanathii TaxID=5486 RepID=A0A367XVY4_9ASCO|nr:Mediator of RNA polymerase II transcription subunit 7 [Candida viswanathii]